MRAFVLDSFDSPPRLRDDLPEPEPADGELLVRVHASSVNPADAAVAGGMLEEMAEHDFPVTLGRDFAGVVEQVGQRRHRYRSATRSTASSPSRTRTSTTAAGPS